MRTLSRYRLNNRTEVKFLQAWLNQFANEQLSVDGYFGAKTQEAVQRYQKANGLSVDGSAGPATQAAAGFLRTRNANIVALEIPFHKIQSANVLLKNGQRYCCKKFADEGRWDIVWNGAFFNMNNLRIVQYVSLSGVPQHYGMSQAGIAYRNGVPFAAKPMTRAESMGVPWDMQAGAPTVIQGGRIRIDWGNVTSSMLNAKTRRNCTGLTKNGILLMFSIANCSVYDMINEGMLLKAEFLQNNDGGGSQSLYMGGSYVITTDGRSVPAAVGLKVR